MENKEKNNLSHGMEQNEIRLSQHIYGFARYCDIHNRNSGNICDSDCDQKISIRQNTGLEAPLEIKFKKNQLMRWSSEQLTF